MPMATVNCETVTVDNMRPCLVDERYPALFHLFVNYQSAIPGASSVVALVEVEDGRLLEVVPRRLRFLDSKEHFGEKLYPIHPTTCERCKHGTPHPVKQHAILCEKEPGHLRTRGLFNTCIYGEPKEETT